MGKFKTERIIIKYNGVNSSKETVLDFKIDIHITQDGSFTCTLPEDIVYKLEQALIDLEKNTRRNARKGYYSAPTLEGLIAQIVKTCEEYVSKEMISEKLIIRYVIETACAYVKDEHNNFFPNGMFLSQEYKDEIGNNGWIDGTLSIHAADPHPFGLRMWTQVCYKREYKYKSGEIKQEFEVLWTPSLDRCSGNENIHWLSNIVSIKPPHGSIQEIDCTEDTALFFVNIYKGIFKINEGIKAFASDQNMIMLFIGQKQKLLF